MLERTKLVALCLTLLIGMTGCATTLTLSSESPPCEAALIYSGTALDYDLVTRWWGGGASQGGFIITMMAMIAIPFGVIDFPLSLTADTVLLPATIPLQIRENRRCESESVTEPRGDE